MRSKIGFFRDCFNFLRFSGGAQASKIEPKSLKSAKKTLKNRCSKKACSSTAFCLDFSRFWHPKMNPKSTFFEYFSKTSILRKSLRNTGCAHKNQGSDFKKTRKITKKSIQKRLRKKHRKKRPKNRRLHPFWPPKASQNRYNIDPGREKKRVWNEACCATLWNLLGNRRKVTEAIVCKASIRPGI